MTIRAAAAATFVFAAFGIATASLPLYQTQFDAPTFTAGDSVDGVEGWQVLSPPATVAAGGAAVGNQFVQLGSGAILDRAFTGTQGEDTLWVQAYFRGRGSSQTLTEIEDEIGFPASAILHFSEANGIEVEDGTGDGAPGPVVQVGVPLGQANQTTWYKITVRLDFEEKAWELWVNDGKRSGEGGFGFRSNQVNNLSGFRQMAQGESGFDGFRVVLPLPGDANGDGAIDAADLVAVIEYLAEPTGDPILRGNADLTGNGDVTEDDLDLLAGKLTAMAP